MSLKTIRNMEEFAAASGLSRPTVSKFFHDPSSVRPSTRRRIEEALEQYDYRPNIYAVNQNRRLTKTIGIVVPFLADPYFAEIARVLEMRCIDAGFSPSLFSSHGRQELENDILDTLRSMKPAGVLLAPLGRGSDRAVIESFCANVPTVLFDSNIDKVGDAFVGSDNGQFTSLMVDYLSRTGGSPWFFEMETPPNPNARKRRQGYIAAMAAQGHEPDITQAQGTGWDLEKIGYEEGLRAIDERKGNCGTVLCSNDRLAIGFLAACFKRGLRVGIDPQCDIRVAGMDGHPISKYTAPGLTTVAHDYETIAGRSVQTLFGFMQDEDRGTQRTEMLFEGKLLMRSSA